MANALVFFSDLHTGRSSSTVQVRLLHFLEARSYAVVEITWESTCSSLILSSFSASGDCCATMMPANVSVNRLALHRPNLKAVSVYPLTDFDVTWCDHDYRLLDSSLLIRFSDSTSFNEVTEPAVPIPHESFRFLNHSGMLGLADSNNQLPGNASHIISSDY
ncbi:hypothetical protein HID58_059588 [Brassica napus]|uniref:Uncharacterized protein n=1 Tax=Brassica napus TaxID=3708 RepID=A0ABQ7ZTW1_BRANA|nr:hypothetical protein HID58_059588 [Brassica napus]